MTEAQLFVLLADKPGLRRAVARDELESSDALRQYRREHFGAGGDDLSFIRTRDVRAELLRLIAEVGR